MNVQLFALKIGGALVALVWGLVGAHNEWGVAWTLTCSVAAVALGYSAAKEIR